MTEIPEPQPVKPRRVIWWRLIVGLYVLFVEIKMHVWPDPNLPEVLKTTNETQEFGANVAGVLISLLGIWLIFSALKPLWRKKAQ